MPSAIVVGAGVFGASIADRLSADGWAVTLVEMERPGHLHAASGGGSRALRFSHGGDLLYTRLARRARELWIEIGEEEGVALFVQAGVLWLVRPPGDWEADSERSLRDEGIPIERVARARARELLPSLVVDGLDHLLLEPEGGVLRARRAVSVLAERALRRGADLVTGVAAPDGAGVSVADRRLEGDVVVWACGAWLQRLFPELVRLRVTKQDTFLLRAPAEWRTPPVPAWIDAANRVYGWGDLDGGGAKVASDEPGPAFDPERGERVASKAGEQAVRSYLERIFPGLGAAPLAGAEVCQYAMTPDSDFILDRHPEHEHLWIAGGGSGHGFKHGPALAERFAAVLAGAEELEPRFSLDRGVRDTAPRGAIAYRSHR